VFVLHGVSISYTELSYPVVVIVIVAVVGVVALLLVDGRMRWSRQQHLKQKG